jgi:hypothetical protein
MSHDMQEEVDTFHNLRVNTQHLSASGGVIRRRGAQTFNKGKQVKPGFEFEADDPRADYVLWQFPDVTMSTLTGENQARAYVETAIGAADSFFGRPNQSAKSGTSFSLENLQASRTDSIFSSIAESIVEGYNDMFQKELMLLLSYPDQTRAMFEDFYNPQEESAKLEALDQLLALAPEDIPGSIKFAVMTTDLARTDEAKRQNAMLKFQVYSMVFDKMTQLVPALSQGQLDPETTRLIMNGIVGYHDMLKETLELAGSTNVDDSLMDVELYRTMSSMMDTMSREQAEQMRSMNEQQRAMGSAGAGAFGGPEPGQENLAPAQPGMEQAMGATGPGPGQGPGMGQGPIG